jgi:chorismate mutase
MEGKKKVMIACRGIRGATTVEENTREAILGATAELLTQMIEANGIQADDVGSVIFTTTPDLTAEYPALAARQLGWTDVALLCTHEMAVPHGLSHCIRILVHWNTDRSSAQIRHVYTKGAVNLRPDRVANQRISKSASQRTCSWYRVSQRKEVTTQADRCFGRQPE